MLVAEIMDEKSNAPIFSFKSSSSFDSLLACFRLNFRAGEFIGVLIGVVSIELEEDDLLFSLFLERRLDLEEILRFRIVFLAETGVSTEPLEPRVVKDDLDLFFLVELVFRREDRHFFFSGEVPII